jgi:peroxiredoxin
MNAIRRTLLTAATVFLAAPLLYAQVSNAVISKQFDKIRSTPIGEAYSKPASDAIIKLAADIRTMRASRDKVDFADDLAHLATKGDQGAEALQAVANTLAQALQESPIKAKNDQPAEQYMELARLVRYENVAATLSDPLFAKAGQILAENDADAEKADFTLKDTKGKPHTFSELRGKIVLVSFWSPACQPCRSELPNLDIIYTHYQSQGLVILSITTADTLAVNKLLNKMDYHPPVLLDADGKAIKQFHVATGYHPPVAADAGGGGHKGMTPGASDDVDGVPRTFVFNREGKLAGQAIDQCTQRQFFEMLAAAGLHP